ncbi:MAG: NADP-dependent phosphogluconate dehydrogenase, partial [Desulfobacterales bacterium]
MKLAMIGLGKMGMNMARRLMLGNHEIIAYDLSKEAVQQITADGAAGAPSLQQVVEVLSAPRIVWIMLPAGKPVEDTISRLKELLSPEDIVIDGGNTYYKDDLRRYQALKEAGIRYMDVGVSGGIWGLKMGYCMMMGGDKDVFRYLEPIFETLAPEDGYLYCGKIGAGHFVKMVHNGIEYGLM